jgi:radical SAM superfamily enzyme YgiQ (UPF0313 family)
MNHTQIACFPISATPIECPVVLVSIDWQRPQDGRTSLGIASIAAALKVAGVRYSLIEVAINDPLFCIEQLYQRIQLALNEAGPDCLLGFGVYVWNDAEICTLIERLRRANNQRIVLGGPQISYMPKGELEAAYPQADLFVRGQGERTMVQLVTGGSLIGCGVHAAGTADQGHKADHDLQELPSPYLSGVITPAAQIRWETQRGCRFKCSFCQHREPGSRLQNRLLGMSRLEEEIQLFARHGVRRISVLDPIFHDDQVHAIELLGLIRQAGLKAHLALQCRFEMITDPFLDALGGLSVTLEFGLQTAIAEEARLIGRPNRLDIVEDVIDKLHARGIDFEVSLIYGLPLQTLASFKHSLAWCYQRSIPHIKAWPLMLLRGTKLYDQKAQFGLTESSDRRIPLVISSHTFSATQYETMQSLADTL